MQTIAQAAPALAMLAAFACLFGGGYLIWTGKDRRKGILMVALSAVLLGNAVIWTL